MVLERCSWFCAAGCSTNREGGYIRHHVQTRLQAANVTSPVLLLATDANREMLSSSTGRPVSRLNVVLSAGVRVRFVVKTREVG